MNLTKPSIVTGMIILLVSGSALAAQPGYFAGVTLGYAKTHSEGGTYDGTASTADSNTGLGYGINGGYNLNHYFGIEGQVNRDASAKYSGTAEGSTFTMKLYDVTALADGYLPINNNVDLVGKAGVAYTRQSYSGGGDYNFYRPTLATGVSYTVTQHMTVSATYSRIFGQGNFSDVKYLPNIDMAAVSIHYLF